MAKKPVPAEKAAPAKKPAKGAKAAKKASPAAPAAPAKKAAAPAAPAKKAKVAAQAPVKKPAAKPAPAAAPKPAKSKEQTKVKSKTKIKPKSAAKSTAQWLAGVTLGQLSAPNGSLVIDYGNGQVCPLEDASHLADPDAKLVLVIRYATAGTLGAQASTDGLLPALIRFLSNHALVGIECDSTCCPPVVNSAKRSAKKKR